MECILFGVIGALIVNGCIYAYKRATRKRVSSKEVMDIVIDAIKRNNGSMRVAINNAKMNQ